METDLEPCQGKGTMVIGYLMLNIAGGIFMESQFKVFGFLAFLIGFLMFLAGNLQNWVVVARYRKNLNNSSWKASKSKGEPLCKLNQAS